MEKIAKYLQVEEYIKQEIACNNLKSGDQILTEEDLSRQFGFSRMTVNKALKHLENQGYIKRIAGRGSFVTALHVKKDMNVVTSFTEDMESRGLTAGAVLISYEVLRGADRPDIAEKLKLGEDDLIHYFVRLRTGNGAPVAVSYTYVSAKVIPAINVDCLNRSFYKFVIEQGLDRDVKYLEVRAALPTEKQKEILGAERMALLCVSHVTYTHSEMDYLPYEYVETYYNSDVYTYTMDL